VQIVLPLLGGVKNSGAYYNVLNPLRLAPEEDTSRRAGKKYPMKSGKGKEARAALQ